MEEKKGNKALKLILKLGLSAVAIYIISQKVDFGKTLTYFGESNFFFLILAVLAFFTSKLVGAFRINVFYKTQGLQLSNGLNYKLYLLGMFYNLFIPLVGGDGYKVYWLNKHYNTKIKNLVWVSLLDRLSGIGGLTALVAILFVFISYQTGYNWLGWLAVPLVYGGHFLFMHLFFKSYNNGWLITSIQSLLVQGLQLACTYFILMALGVEEGVVDYLFIFLLSCYAYVLPMIGAREMAFVFGAEYMGLDPDLSLAIGIIFYISLAINSLFGAYFLYRPITPENGTTSVDSQTNP